MLAAKNLIEESVSKAVYTITPDIEQSSITDRLGIFGSALCLVHCLLLPLLLPLFSANSNSEHVAGLESWFHDLIFPALFLFAAMAFSKGYRQHHSKSILILGISGISLIALGLFSDHLDISLLANLPTPAGSVLLVFAHILNISKLKRANPHIHSSTCGCGSYSVGKTSPKLIQLNLPKH